MKPTRPEDAPGYKCRPNKNGTFREYWEVSEPLRKAGYKPAVVPLPAAVYPDTPAGRAACAAKCRRLTAEAKTWKAGGGNYPKRGYDGTVASLARLYESDPYSPFRRRYGEYSRTRIAHDLKNVVAAVGGRRVALLRLQDFAKWEEESGKPKTPGGPARPWRARNFMAAVRKIISYGKASGYPDCRAAQSILEECTFSVPGTRKQRMNADHLDVIRETAHAMGLPSVALACTIQFETGLRQVDVIGRWLRDPNAVGGIEFNGRLWGMGLTWAMLDAAWVLRKVTTKRGVPVQHPVKLSPTLMAEIERVPLERRVGPVIISDTTGEPYKHSSFGVAFRRVREAAGLPSDLQNRDARSGAATEALSAGAALTDVMRHLGHTDPKITLRYDKGSPEQSGRVIVMRQEKRLKNGK